ncbi:MAG: hypothetical protein WAV78_29400, partial [Xanthobacteraceae bacterium]
MEIASRRHPEARASIGERASKDAARLTQSGLSPFEARRAKRRAELLRVTIRGTVLVAISTPELLPGGDDGCDDIGVA